MKKTLFPFLLFLLSACAMAATVVQPHNSVEWTNPTLNSDGSPLTDLVSVTFDCGGVQFTVLTTTPGASLSEPLPAGVLALSGSVTCTGIATSASGGDSVIPSNPVTRWCDTGSCYGTQPAYCNAGVCYDAIPPDPPVLGSSGGSAQQVPAWLSVLAANEAVELPGTSIASVWAGNDPSANPNFPAAPPWKGISGAASITSAWNGANYLNHTMWVSGGGHGDYGGWEFYRLDLTADAPIMVLHDYPTPDVTTEGAATNVYSDGTPRIPHTYSSLAMTDSGLIVYSQGNTPYPNKPANTTIFEFDSTVAIADRYAQHVAAWANTGVSSSMPGTPKGTAVFNPRDGWVYMVYASGPPVGFGRYDPVSDVFEVLATSIQSGVGMGGSPIGEIIPAYGDNGLMVIQRGDDLGMYVIDLATLTRNTVALVDPSNLLAGSAPFTYDAVNNCIWTWAGGNTLGRIDVPADPFGTWTVTPVAITGAMPATPEPSGTFGRMRADIIDGVAFLVLVNRYAENAHVVRVN